ncbi:MAG: shikimate dehydrogenase [Bacteroidetes bacterium]|nr:shikimate dehydrogenase [Bacteroidota bacterium]
MNSKPCRFGLIGYPLEHTASARYFAKKFEREGLSDYSYSLFPLMNVDEVRHLISGTPGLQGLNVTIPYKQSIIPFLDRLDPVAEEIGAVNTVAIRPSGQGFELTGYNTDAEGFRRSLRPDFHHKQGLVLGTGGSSKAVTYILRKMSLVVLKASRTLKQEGVISYQEINGDILEKYTFIVNCTPVGMFPDVYAVPDLPFSLLRPYHEVYDLIYNPVETMLLRFAREAGTKVQNGQKMLELQAELAFDIWMGARP